MQNTDAQQRTGSLRCAEHPRIGIGIALVALAAFALAAAPASAQPGRSGASTSPTRPFALAAAPAAAQQDMGNLMRQKLDRAQGLFEAVVLARFPAVERYAGDLLRISERSAWTPLTTATYLRFAGEFQEAARSLGRAAAARDIDEVSTAYMTLTSSCVQCHRLLRESGRAERNRTPGHAPPRNRGADDPRVIAAERNRTSGRPLAGHPLAGRPLSGHPLAGHPLSGFGGDHPLRASE